MRNMATFNDIKETMRLQSDFFTARSGLTTRILYLCFEQQGDDHFNGLLSIFQAKASPTRLVFNPIGWRLEHDNER